MPAWRLGMVHGRGTCPPLREAEAFLTCRNHRAWHRPVIVGGLVLLMALNPGCFAERSFRMNAGESVRVAPSDGDGAGVSARQWLRQTHAAMSQLLPRGTAEPLLTEDLTNGNGQAADVFKHFGMDRESLQSLVHNFRGLLLSGQAASREYHIDKPAPPWPGFEDVWIPLKLPIDDKLELCARLGYARDANGEIREADCLVILPGLFGDNGVKRSADIAMALHEAGFHVCSLELRGHGQTEARYPRMYHTFGVVETDDVMQVSDWLEALPHVRRTGLIGYCWTANIALLAAWYDGRRPDDPYISPALRRYLVTSPRPDHPRFSAGVIAFSPVLRWEVLMDELDRPRSRWKHPIFAAIQDTVRDRMVRKGYPQPDGNLRRLIQFEHDGYNIPMPRGAAEGYPMLRLLPYKDEPAGDKLEHSRVPVLIVHGADDPLVPAQDVADLVASVRNPKVAAVILPQGGHVGFAGYAPKYYLSMVINFFDPVVGAAVQQNGSRLNGHPVAVSPGAKNR